MPICLSKITISPPCHCSVSETLVVSLTVLREKNAFRFRTLRKSIFLSGAVIPYSSGCSRMSVSTRACRSYPAFSEHMLPHQYRLHSRRRDNRSHNSGFCILDVYSHMPVRRSGCLSGRLHRHRLRLLCCAAAGSGQKIYPSVGQQKCADNGIKSNGKSRQQKHPHRPDCRFSLHLIFPLLIDTISPCLFVHCTRNM